MWVLILCDGRSRTGHNPVVANTNVLPICVQEGGCSATVSINPYLESGPDPKGTPASSSCVSGRRYRKKRYVDKFSPQNSGKVGRYSGLQLFTIGRKNLK